MTSALVGPLLAVGAVLLSAAFGSASMAAESARAGLGPVPAGARYLSPTGSNANPGTRDRPWRTLSKAVSAARPGTTVVLLPGTYGALGETSEMRASGTAERPIVFRGEPGATRPTIRGHVKITGSHQRFDHLLFDGPTGPVLRRTSDNPDGEQVLVSVYGPGTRGVEISDSEVRGSRWHAGVYVSGTRGVRITGNYIHHNGRSASRNHDHGIYVGTAKGTRISGNVIYDNTDRGIQLYPAARGTTITGNVIDGNGQGVLIGADGRQASRQTLVERNLITNAALRGNVESDFGPGEARGRGNRVRFNCIHGTAKAGYAGKDGSGIERPTRGFSARANVSADPRYVDRAAKDFSLASDSPCASLGERIDLTSARKAKARRRSLVLSGVVPGPVRGPGSATLGPGSPARRLAHRGPQDPGRLRAVHGHRPPPGGQRRSVGQGQAGGTRPGPVAIGQAAATLARRPGGDPLHELVGGNGAQVAVVVRAHRGGAGLELTVADHQHVGMLRDLRVPDLLADGLRAKVRFGADPLGPQRGDEIARVGVVAV